MDRSAERVLTFTALPKHWESVRSHRTHLEELPEINSRPETDTKRTSPTSCRCGIRCSWGSCSRRSPGVATSAGQQNLSHDVRAASSCLGSILMLYFSRRYRCAVQMVEEESQLVPRDFHREQQRSFFDSRSHLSIQRYPRPFTPGSFLYHR